VTAGQGEMDVDDGQVDLGVAVDPCILRCSICKNVSFFFHDIPIPGSSSAENIWRTISV
jgi:hypothetical protein